ncbi:MAG: aldehyde dehydrogenase family protein [Thermoanaerobaculia bacterium]
MSRPEPPFEGMLVGGVRADGARASRRFVLNPATGDPIASVAEAELEDVDRAAHLASVSFRTDWRKRTPRERARILFRLAGLVRDHVDELAGLESRNVGKPLGSARAEVLSAADCFEYYAGAVTKFGGETLPASAPGTLLTMREPLGVCALIVPWNFPIVIASWKLAPALAMGNTVLLKPASDTPLSALRLGELALQAGVPPEALHVLPGRGEVLGPALINHPLVRKISFTGSTEVGRGVMVQAARGIKRVSLELGGKSACILFADAELDTCLPSALWSAIDNSGQDCCARSRFLVEKSIYDRVVADLATLAAAVRVGDPSVATTEMGPLITGAHLERVGDYLRIGKDEGAELVCGGETPALDATLERGFYLSPAIFANVENRMRVAQEEIFGPVISVIPFTDEADAVRLANESRYGLSGSLFTRDMGRALRVAGGVETGVLSINSSRSVFVEAPFGGVKESGLGRELGKSALEAYSELKTIFLSNE